LEEIAVIKNNLREAQIRATQRIELGLESGGALNVMSCKADRQGDAVQTFHGESMKLKNEMCFERFRWYVVGARVAV
jgi:vesicle-associated membrane protein 7